MDSPCKIHIWGGFTWNSELPLHAFIFFKSTSIAPSHDSATPPLPQKAPLNWAWAAQPGQMPLKEAPPRLGGWSPDLPWASKDLFLRKVGSVFCWDLLSKNCSLFNNICSDTDVHYKNLDTFWTLQKIIFTSCNDFFSLVAACFLRASTAMIYFMIKCLKQGPKNRQLRFVAETRPSTWRSWLFIYKRSNMFVASPFQPVHFHSAE